MLRNRVEEGKPSILEDFEQTKGINMMSLCAYVTSQSKIITLEM